MRPISRPDIRRRLMAPRPAALAACLLALSAVAAAAQGFGPSGRLRPQPPHSSGNAVPREAPADIPVVQEAWPRLDPGAIFCRSQADLDQHLAAVAEGLSGGSAAAKPSGCTLVQKRTPIQVIDRNGPGRTEVRVTAGGETGWTDAFLPERRR